MVRRRRALAAAGIVRYAWQPKDGVDGVDAAAEAAWKARERACWDALLEACETGLAALEVEQTRDWRRLLARHERESERLPAALGGGWRAVPALWWLRLRRHGARGLGTLRAATRGDRRAGLDWEAALQLRQQSEAAALGDAHEARIRRLATRAGRAYAAAMRGLAERCRRDAEALLPAAEDDLAAGVEGAVVEGFLETGADAARD